MMSITLLCVFLLLYSDAGQRDKNQEKSVMECLQDIDPAYQNRWPGLFERIGEMIVSAPEEDIIVAKGYPDWKEKGPWVDCRRITIMSKKTDYRVDEEIRIIHVFENIEKQGMVYVMGPKKVFGEYMDEKVIHPLPIGENYFQPETYNGIILTTPALDYNFEITSYHFSKPGIHSIYWKIETLKSNVLSFEIVP